MQTRPTGFKIGIHTYYIALATFWVPPCAKVSPNGDFERHGISMYANEWFHTSDIVALSTFSQASEAPNVIATVKGESWRVITFQSRDHVHPQVGRLACQKASRYLPDGFAAHDIRGANRGNEGRRLADITLRVPSWPFVSTCYGNLLGACWGINDIRDSELCVFSKKTLKFRISNAPP